MPPDPWLCDSHLVSPQNPQVKELVELREDGEVRRARGCFLLEGERAVAEALAQPEVEIRELLYCERLLSGGLDFLERARARRIRLVRVSRDVFKKLAAVKTPQGLAAVVAIRRWPREPLLARSDALLLVACGLQDPGNLGTLIRSCRAAGAAALLALEGTADPYNAKVVRSSAAALLSFPVLRMKSSECLAWLRAGGARLVAAVPRNGADYLGFDWRARPLALCIGSEGQGLPPEVESACREKVTISMREGAESLNAAVAAGILLFRAQSGAAARMAEG